MVCGTLLAGGVLQMKREQAGKAGAAPTSCQQGSDWLLKDADGAASGDQVGVRLERTHGVQFCPRVHVHLRKKNHFCCHNRSESTSDIYSSAAVI